MKLNIPALLYLLILGSLIGCSSDDGSMPPPDDGDDLPSEVYFPATGSSEWETISPSQLGWDTQALEPLHDYLETNDTKAFLILWKGRIAVEDYFGTFTRDSIWYWASAGKTLTCFTVGIAQEEGLLSIQDKTSDYLGTGWTSAPAEKEALITVWNQLTMTTGLRDTAFDCVTPDCLEYIADAGNRWAYHNGPYTLLQSVVSTAAGSTYSNYFTTRLRDRIGMDGFWLSTNGLNNVYFSTARSMARFGLLNLNNGKWGSVAILGDDAYLNDMKNTSQGLNASYGYLWWLNGKPDYRLPGLQLSFTGPLIPEAPDDTFAGLGKNDQKLYVVPSKELVVVRMGEDTGENRQGPSSFDNGLWQYINDLVP